MGLLHGIIGYSFRRLADNALQAQWIQLAVTTLLLYPLLLASKHLVLEIFPVPWLGYSIFGSATSILVVLFDMYFVKISRTELHLLLLYAIYFVTIDVAHRI